MNFENKGPFTANHGLVFEDYESKPVTRKAYKLTAEDINNLIPVAPHRFNLRGQEFMAYEDIKKGDYIVFLNEDDVYHCNAKVFAERNVV